MIIRDFELVLEARLREKLNFIQVVLGPRQVGKTTGVERLFEAWAGPKRFVTVDTTVPADHGLLQAEWAEAERLGEGALLVIDEVQKVLGWADVIKPAFDKIRKKRTMKIVLLGSASLSIGQGLGESLAGRFEVIQAPHWSYAEAHKAFGIDFETFLRFGGYPAALELIHDPKRWSQFMRDSIIEPVLGRDLQGAVRIDKPALFRQAFEVVMNNPAQIVGYHKIIGQLQGRGSAETIKYYLQLFEHAFLVKQLPKFTQGTVISKTSSPKLIPLDLGLVSCLHPTAALADPHAWRGHLVEAAFGAHLARQGGDLYYWSEGRVDVDFVHVLDGQITAYEIKSGRERDAQGLLAFQERYPSASIRLLDDQEIAAIFMGQA